MTPSPAPPALDAPRSIWLRDAPAIATDPVLPAAAEVVVVGAGLTGLATAAMLARTGRRVVVLEARRIGAVTTGNTTGKLSLLQGTVLSEIRARNGDEALRRYVDANRTAQRWLLDEVAGVDGAAEARDAVTYATSADGDEAIAAELEAARAGGLGAELLTGAGTRALGLPFRVSSALRVPAQAQLQPMLVLARLAAAVREAGGIIVEGRRVTDAVADDGSVVVRTADGDIEADHVVLATGTPILDRGLFFAKLEPSRSLAAAYALDGRTGPTGMLISADEPRRSLRTAATATGPVLVVGGESFPTGRAASVRELVEKLDEWTAEHFGRFRRVAWWAAQDYRTFSRLPFAGPLPRGGGRIHAATGYDKWGMTNAVAAAADLVAGIVDGREAPEEDDRELPDPAPSLAAAGSAVATSAAVAARAVAGWVQPGDRDPVAEGEGHVVRDGLAPVAESLVDGVACRVSAVCTHLGGVVAWNDAERSWDCPLHASRFAPDGTVLEGPAVEPLAAVADE